MMKKCPLIMTSLAFGPTDEQVLGKICDVEVPRTSHAISNETPCNQINPNQNDQMPSVKPLGEALFQPHC